MISILRCTCNGTYPHISPHLYSPIRETRGSGWQVTERTFQSVPENAPGSLAFPAQLVITAAVSSAVELTALMISVTVYSPFHQLGPSTVVMLPELIIPECDPNASVLPMTPLSSMLVGTLLGLRTGLTTRVHVTTVSYMATGSILWTLWRGKSWGASC